MNTTEIKKIPSLFSKTIVSCIIEIAEDYQIRLQTDEMITTNGLSKSAWDDLNKKIVSSLPPNEYVTIKISPGGWEMILIQENSTKRIFTLMKETNFRNLHRKGNFRTHYSSILSSYNNNLSSNWSQLSIFDNENDDISHRNYLEDRIQKLFRNNIDTGEVSQYVLLLFDEYKFHIKNIRWVVLNSSLNILAEENLNKHIPFEESVLVEQIEDSQPSLNHPEQNLSLSPKAIERLGRRNLRFKEGEKGKKSGT